MAIACLRAQSLGFHQPINALFTTALAHVVQIIRDFAIAVDQSALNLALLNLTQQATILCGMGRVERLLPSIEAT